MDFWVEMCNKVLLTYFTPLSSCGNCWTLFKGSNNKNRLQIYQNAENGVWHQPSLRWKGGGSGTHFVKVLVSAFWGDWAQLHKKNGKCWKMKERTNFPLLLNRKSKRQGVELFIKSHTQTTHRYWDSLSVNDITTSFIDLVIWYLSP